jgi:hypothetical protein
VKLIVDQVLNWIEEQLQEDILFVRKSLLKDIFQHASALVGDSGEKVRQSFGPAKK